MDMGDGRVQVATADIARHGEALVALNNAAEPAVNAIVAADLAFFADHGHVLAAQSGGAPCGLLVLLPPGVSYDSSNYRWFSARYDRFLYVDRVVVGANARGTGVGRMLYRAAFDAVQAAGHTVLLAEVNTRPPNPGSLGFHAQMGFKVLKERENLQSGKRVAMMERPLAGPV